MTDVSPLRRKIGASKSDAPAVPSPERVWRRAVTHAMGRGLSLEVDVTSVTRSALMPEGAVDLMADGVLVVLLDGPGAGGLAFLDPGPLAAIIETQTRGGLGKRAVSGRAPTTIDASLAADTVDRILTTFDMMTAELGLTGTVSGYRFGTQISQPREIGLALQDAPHDLWRLDLTFPQSETRAGALQILLPQVTLPALPDRTPMDAWSEKIERRVMGSEIALQAELGRITLTADTLRRLEVGQSLTLPRNQIDRVVLRTPDGPTMGTGRLGQSAGRKAVRIEPSAPDQPFRLGATKTADEAG